MTLWFSTMNSVETFGCKTQPSASRMIFQQPQSQNKLCISTFSWPAPATPTVQASVLEKVLLMALCVGDEEHWIVEGGITRSLEQSVEEIQLWSSWGCWEHFIRSRLEDVWTLCAMHIHNADGLLMARITMSVHIYYNSRQPQITKLGAELLKCELTALHITNSFRLAF